MPKVPFLAGAVPVFLTFYLTLLVWWWTMGALWRTGNVTEGVMIAYLLPGLFLLATSLARKKTSALAGLVHYIVLAAVGIALFVRVVTLNPFVPIQQVATDWGPILGIAFISGVVTIMTYPMAGSSAYSRYKSPLFVGGVVFMPLFVAVAAVLNAPLSAVLKGTLVMTLMVGFWSSAAWLSSRRTEGDYVAGLELKPLMPFRPDLILPGGVNYIKGTIMTGLGYMIMSAPVNGVFPPPVWNWWGFVLAFWGIITIIPLRGMFKMLSGKRPRMLGENNAFGFSRSLWAREAWLYLGLLILMYGFLNAFMGTVPFTKLNPFHPMVAPPNPLYGVVGTLLLAAAFVILVPIRGWYKTKLLEGAESSGQLVLKGVILWVGTFVLIYGLLTLFMGVFTSPHADTFRLALGMPLFIGGIVLVVLFRPIALRNELLATLRVMPGSIAVLPEEKRRAIMSRRTNALLAMPESQRDIHVTAMMQGISRLPEELRGAIFKTNLEVLSSLPEDKRTTMMKAMDKAMGMK